MVAKILVVAGALPDTEPPSPSDNDVDEFNKPRLRRDIILSSLRTRDEDDVTVTFTAVPKDGEVLSLVDLYSCVHDTSLINFLTTAWERWEGMSLNGQLDRDNIHPSYRLQNKDETVVPPLVSSHSAFRSEEFERPGVNVMGQIGYYCTDQITPIVDSLTEELCEDALVVCSAVTHAMHDAELVVYAMTTHPGHHANRSMFGGYCYLNNAAMAARLMQKQASSGRSIFCLDEGRLDKDFWAIQAEDESLCQSCQSHRIAILDIDYHCGNGTASIFYSDPTVLFVSIHCDPSIEYPWNSGYKDQTGSGEGVGKTVHIPLPAGTAWKEYKVALSTAMEAVAAFDPIGFVVSMGLDTHDGDAVAVNRGGFKLRGQDYFEMGRHIGSYFAGNRIPTVFVQEGGYKMDVVGEAAANVVLGYSHDQNE